MNRLGRSSGILVGGAFVALVVLLAGCFTAQQNRTERSEPREMERPSQGLAVYQESQIPEAAYDALGEVEGVACQKDVYAPTAKRSDAIAEMRRKARRRNANALVNVNCQKTGRRSECMSALRCTGEAARIASVRSLAEMSNGTASGRRGDDAGIRGTGWVVSPRLVATAYDLVEGRSEFQLSLRDTVVSANLVASDVVHNLALLQPRSSSVLPAPIPVANKTPRLGQRVFTVGYDSFADRALGMRTSTGIISAQSGSFGDPRLVQTTVPFPFNGGSAPLFDYRGQVVGLLLPTRAGDAGMRGRQTSTPFTYAVKGEYLTALADSVAGRQPQVAGALPPAQGSLSTLLDRVRPSVLMVTAR